MNTVALSCGMGLIASSIIYAFAILLRKQYNRLQNIRDSVIDIGELNLEGINNNYVVLGAIVTFISILILFKNIVPALISVVMIVLIPSQVAYIVKRRNKAKVMEQLATATKLFTDNYVISLNIKMALQSAAKGSTGVVSDIFKATYFKLAYGKSLENALDDMAKELGTAYGHMFTNLVKLAAVQGNSIVSLLYDLVSRIRLSQEQENYKYSETTVDNTFNIILLVAPIVEYFILVRIVPQVSVFVLDTRAGTILFTLWLMGVIVWFIIDRIIAEY